MPEPVVRRRIADVLDAVRNRPHVLPARELAALQGSGVDVGIERTDGETVVVVEPRADDRLACLSPREREVVTLAAAGMSNQQIATTLFVSVATVKDHMHSVLKKTGLESRTQVVAAWYGGLPGNPGTATTTTNTTDTSDEPAGSD
ncbi:helix-turn-helix transcriptional regulator [Ilumatobacter sp.]|uniref:helix-turn-helix transcriptional regulator n=1 Tax=Ilumatobacter sp. TaxID=1967498 RepID=UPI003AF7D3CB